MRSIDRRLRWAACALAVIATAPSARGQLPRLTPTDVAQIANGALRVVVPPEANLSGVTVGRRGVAFDMKRSLAAFGASAPGDTLPALRRAGTFASRSVLRDCSQAEQKPCAALGSRVYVFIEPVSVTGDRAVVRVNLSWADRRHFGANASPREGAYLAGASHKLYFARSASGAWAFEREDASVITS